MIVDTPWMPAVLPGLTGTAATSAEAIAGLDATKYISPSTLRAADAVTANPRAPRQALAFDGATSAAFTTPVLGTGDFCVSAVVNPSSLASPVAIMGGVNNSFSFFVQTTGALTSSKTNVANNTSSTGVIAAGIVSHVAYSRLSGVGTYYINGVAAGTTTDAQNYSEAVTQLGSAASAYYFLGSVSGFYPFNRALSAAEVLALHQEGAPRAADYAAGLVGTTVNATAMVIGRRYRILVVGTTTFTSHGATANTVGTEFIATSVGTGTGTTTAIGLLCAPDANQPGAGLEWLDASGNRAHLTLPTSGVRWTLPNVSGQIVVEATVTHSGAGNVQLAGAALVDTGRSWRIVSATAVSTAIATVSLGNVSAGAQHVSGAVLAVGNNALTVVTGAGNFLSTANLWSNSSAAATIRYTLVLAPV